MSNTDCTRCDTFVAVENALSRCAVGAYDANFVALFQAKLLAVAECTCTKFSGEISVQ